jgi:hypothetical protein
MSFLFSVFFLFAVGIFFRDRANAATGAGFVGISVVNSSELLEGM